jgi:hypothetical protein
MNIHVVVCARNEADIIEPFVRHTLQWAQKVHMVLHRCHDNSADIVRRLSDEGAPLFFEHDANLLHQHGATMTRLAHAAAQEGADWVFPIDVDEFVLGSVHDVCREGDASTPIEIPWRGYVPLPTDIKGDPNVLTRIQHRRICRMP